MVQRPYMVNRTLWTAHANAFALESSWAFFFSFCFILNTWLCTRFVFCLLRSFTIFICTVQIALSLCVSVSFPLVVILCCPLPSFTLSISSPFCDRSVQKKKTKTTSKTSKCASDYTVNEFQPEKLFCSWCANRAIIVGTWTWFGRQVVMTSDEFLWNLMPFVSSAVRFARCRLVRRIVHNARYQHN